MDAEQIGLTRHIIIELKDILSNKFGVDKCELKDVLSGDIIQMCKDDHVSFTGYIEKRFDILISLDDGEGIYTLKDAVHYVWSKIEEVPPLADGWKDVIKGWLG